jgi:hypothetical protein
MKADLLIYDYSGWDGFLAPMLFPDALRIQAAVGDGPRRILSELSPNCNTVIYHVDLTVTRGFLAKVDEAIVGLRQRGVRVINGYATDISKRALHQCCGRIGIASAEAGRHGDPNEVLIVKTNYNSGADPEQRLNDRERRLCRVGSLSRSLRGPGDYFTAPRAAISTSLWNDGALIIEAYMHNGLDRHFRIYKSGAQFVVSVAISPDALKRMEIGCARRNYFFSERSYLGSSGSNEDGLRQPVERCLDALTMADKVMRALGVDFGAVDIVEDAPGNLYPVDVNKTPYWDRNECQPGMLEHLREGLV